VNSTPMNQGGQVNVGDSLTMSAACSGTIYYTNDGTDPRTWTTAAGSTPPFNTVLVAEGATKKVLVPSGSVSDDWKGGNEPFNDSTWTNYSFVAGKPGSVGYEKASGYEGLISYDVGSYLYGNSATQSCLIRIPFSVDAGQLANMTYLTLRARYDDAFVAYINGTEVYRSPYVPNPLLWSSVATGYGADATNLVDYNISAFLSTLHAGSNNVLAIHGLNCSSTSSDFLISAQLEAGAVGSGLIPGGAISPSAIQYTGPITLTRSEYIKARLKNGTNWGALNEACYSVGPVASNLRITELMYHPEDTGNPDDPNKEFIELKNIGATAINLNLVKFTNGVEFTFPNTSLAAGGYVLVVKDQTAFVARYGSGFNSIIAGEYSGSLNNAGEEIDLVDAVGTKILDFTYSDGWYPITDGSDFTLNIINPANPDVNSWNLEESWQASNVKGGSPGAAYASNVAANGAVVINEVLTHQDDPVYGDWIELYNTTASPINIGGWFLSDSDGNFKKYEIAAGTTIPAHGYKVFTEDANFSNTGDAGCHTVFALSELGEQVFLSSGSAGQLSGGYSIKQDFDAMTKDVTIGRYTKSAAAGYDVDFTAMASATKGAANSGPLVPDVVINEIMYHSGNQSDKLAEYIELYNRSGSTVKLYDVSNPTNTWKFTNGIDFTFPAGVTLGPGKYLLVSRSNPTIFRTVYSVPSDVNVFGPFANGTALANDGEKVELSRPETPEPDGYVPYIRVEQVNYSDGSHPAAGAVSDPWPTTPDGGGKSLGRKVPGNYGNDVDNWQAVTPSPGQ